ncbi:response regulator transcription factor [Idiomarina xiamenensis]|uniref:Response regulator n=1 Tax=Idiomarina xiamenensis 10-D-4 TaxID=740709 RepID=K2L2U1_9GAMM|nr:response regulator transcription factor [Idiomarina xiamenensis]EKE84205.1 response regulator [Idiomarina xiamenensis 10-D-4]
MDVLLVEDDKWLGQAIEIGLTERDFQITWVRSGAAAIGELQRQEYQLLILDLGLPDIDGQRVLQSVRRKQLALPVMILTARDETDQVVQALDSGADDYVTKPFDLNELAARLRALYRRRGGHASAEIQVGSLRLNVNSHEVWVADDPVRLSRREFDLLQLLVSQQRRVFSREQLERQLHHDETPLESNALEVHIHNLRKKLKHKDWIETIRGIGYRFSCD